ncbi:hypothetical protein WCE41_03625 [Luteimonas sp. MJ246]|uniref:hypothetical protein n=1 Tax=Luteimonas sp. MJ174 TaxID=3129237 RepID=UPI0031BBB7A5
MAFTRAQATELLNKAEMRLYEESRANALRGFDRAALAGRVVRTRAARDRARDLLKRQRLAARKRGDGKAAGAGGVAARTARKEALLAEILGRFSDARRDAPAAVAKKASTRTVTAKKAVAKKAVAKKGAVEKGETPKAATTKTSTKKAATTKAATRKAVTTKPAAKQPATKKAATKKAATKKAATKKAATKKSAVENAAGAEAASPKTAPKRAAARKTAARTAAAPRRLSPERALANTRKLLEAKQERDRSPQPWQSLDPGVEHVPQPGYQSPQAASKAQDLHAGESRMASIHGSMSTTDRHNQGKRDGRGDTD